MKKFSFLALICVILFTSCKTKKSATGGKVNALTTERLSVVSNAMEQNKYEFDYLSLRAKGDFEGMGMKQNLSLSIRMERHKIVWVSVQALFGIEVARMLVTEDSLFIQQTLPERKYIEMPLDSVSKFLAVPLSVTQLQDFLVGNPILPYKNANSSMKQDTVIVEKHAGSAQVIEYILGSLVKIVRTTAASSKDASYAEVMYGEFQAQNTKSLPTKVNIFVDTKDIEARCDLTYTSISNDKISQFPFRKQD